MGLTAAIAIVIACYALGCVTPSYYAVKWKTGHDLRKTGTGTVGSTNAGRLLGRPAWFLLTGFDILKGWVAPFAAARAGLTDWWWAAAGVAVVAGHLWPVQLRFTGGKGLSTSAGVLLFASPAAVLLMAAVLAATWLALRSSTLAVVQAYLAGPLLALALGLDPVRCGLFFVMAAVVAITHRRNIREALQRRRERAAPSTESSAA
jgi:acyl phosphate:glycerol-3-phosphate acyltransferase